MFLIRIQIIFLIALSFLFSQDETRDEDVIHPELTSLSFSPNAIDVTENSQTVTVSVGFSDDISGTTNIFGYFYSPSGGQNSYFSFYPSGDDLAQELTTLATFDQYIEGGTWSIDYLYLTDQVGNWISYDKEDLVGMGFETDIEVTSNQDVNHPVLTSINFSPNAVNVTESSQTVTLSVGFSDDISGTTNIYGYFYSPSAGQNSYFSFYPSGDDLAQELTTVVTFDQYIEGGTWSIDYLYLTDQVGNWISYDKEDLVGMGFETDIEVTSIQDVNHPELTSLSISPNVVNVTESSQTVTLSVGFSDDISGTTNIYGYFYSPSAGQNSYFSFYPSGDDLAQELTTVATFDQYIETGTWSIDYLYLTDQVGNWISYDKEDLIDMGFEIDVEVLDGVISGCMDPYADNYNENAEYEDGSCTYPDNGDYSLSFDGVDDYVEVETSSSLEISGDISIAAWIKIDDFEDGSATIINKISEGELIGYGLEKKSTQNKISFWVGDGNSFNEVSSNLLETDTWYHVTGTNDGTNSNIYINGEFINSASSGYPAGPSANLKIGLHSTQSQPYRHWDGLINDVSLWSKVLTLEEIQFQLNNSHYTDEPDLVGNWKFNSGVGDILYDHSGNQNHGTIVGATWVSSYDCDLTHVQAYLYDSYGDGWNGNTLDIANGLVSLTLDGVEDDGASAMFDICLPDGTHPVVCDGGNWQSEVSWELVNAADGTLMLAGGAPYSDLLQIGEVVDVLGCTDPNAYNYDATATVDDGTCYYEGDLCEVAIPALSGDVGNLSTGSDQWFTYTATMSGTITATTCYLDQLEDTKLEVFTGGCENLILVGSNDDASCGDVTGGNNYASELEFDVVQGEIYLFFWDDYWGPGSFTWYLFESPPPSTPYNLTVTGGLENAVLNWTAFSTSRNVNTIIPQNDVALEQDELEYRNQKKSMILSGESDVHIGGSVSSNFATNSRNTAVTIVCDGGDWQEEISWDLIDSEGVLVASGGAPAGLVDENDNFIPLTASLDDGVYTLNAFDSYGDGWNGNYFSVYSETMTYISWTLADGLEGSVTFTVDSELANLSLENITYNQEEDLLTVDIFNSGGISAWDIGLSYYLFNLVSDECNNSNADAVFSIPYLAAGENLTFEVVGIEGYLGYGTFEIGNMIDFYCTVPESNENDNIVLGTITINNPLEDISFNIYRSLDSEEEPSFLQVGTSEEDTFVDEEVSAGNYVWYVTQINSGVESGPSNYAYATVYGEENFPPPTNLIGYANGFNVDLQWTAPDLDSWVEPLNSGIVPNSIEKIDNPADYTYYNPSDYPTPRQGGDTYADAITIDALPFVMTGTTAGYNDNYDEQCPYDGSTSPDVVYSFSSTVDTAIVLSLCGEGNLYDTKLYVYEGVMGTLATTITGDPACNDDFCENSVQNWLSYLEGVVINANTTYYVVVDGFGGEFGDYELEVFGITPPPPPPPVSGYMVYRNGEVVNQLIGYENTSYSEYAFGNGPQEYSYHVTAMYEDWNIESASTDTVQIATTYCYGPNQLEATIDGNQVELSWQASSGGGLPITYFNGELGTGIGAGTSPFELAILAQEEMLAPHYGNSLTKIDFVPYAPAQSIEIKIYDPASGLPIQSVAFIDGEDLVIGQWNEVMVPEPIEIIPGQNIMFGYELVGLDGEFAAGADTGPAVQGFGDLIKGFGVDWGSMAYAYALDYNWAIIGYSSNVEGVDPSHFNPIQTSVPSGGGNLLSSRLTDPISLSFSHESNQDRSQIGYNIYRNGELISTVGNDVLYYEEGVPYNLDGDIIYEYWVTSLHDDEFGCDESYPSNSDSVELLNPLNDFSLLVPEDISMVVDLTPMFTWNEPSEISQDGENFSSAQISESVPSNSTKKGNHDWINANDVWIVNKRNLDARGLEKRARTNTSINRNQNRNVAGYHFYLSEDENFENLHISQFVTENFYEPSSLSEDELYYWKVVAIYNGEPTRQSDTWSFWTNNQNSPPSEVVLLGPDSGEEIGLIPTFSWTQSEDSDLYDAVNYTVSFGSDVSSMVEVHTESDTTYTSEAELSDNSEYFWFVTATDQSGATFTTNIQSFTVNSDNDLPGDFALLAPEHGSMVTDLTPTMMWEEPEDPDDTSASTGTGSFGELDLDIANVKNMSATVLPDNSTNSRTITSYDVYVAMDNAFTDAAPVTVETNSYTPDTDLTEDMMYYWKVVAIDDGGGQTESSVQSFWTNSENSAPSEFTLLTPLAHEEVGLTPMFSWTESGDADLNDEVNYHMSMGMDISSMLAMDMGTELQYTVDVSLEDNMEYYWYVTSMDQSAATYTTDVHTFIVNTGNDSPDAVSLVAPLDGSIQSDLTPNFYWTESEDPDPMDHVTYTMSWWEIGTMDAQFIDLDTNGVTPGTELMDNTGYHWTVNAVDMDGASSQSDTSHFFADAFPEPPATFATLTPINDAAGVGTEVEFTWEAAVDPDPIETIHYRLAYVNALEDWQDTSLYIVSEPIIEGTSITLVLEDNSQYYWGVIARDSDGFIVSSNDNMPNTLVVGTLSIDEDLVPEVFALHQNYPNPFNPTTQIRYDLPKDEFVSVTIYDVMGRKIRSLMNTNQAAGYHTIRWDARNDMGEGISAGMYIYTIQAGEFRSTKKMVLLK